MKDMIRTFILKHPVSRELFFFFGRRKANLKKVDRALKKGNIKCSEKKAEDVIVSLTSYGERIAELKYTLYSLVMQSVRPKRIVVNIAFSDEDKITPELRQFEKYGVEFYLTEDLRSYKKLIPTVMRFPEKTIVTCDDDIFFPKKWLQILLAESEEHPHDIISHLVYRNDIIQYYLDLKNDVPRPKLSAIVLGGGGCLYPPTPFHKDLCNKELFMMLAPTSDDFWFSLMALLKGIRIRTPKKSIRCFRYVNPYREYGIIDGDTLTTANYDGGQNKTALCALLKHYNLNKINFMNMADSLANHIKVSGREKSIPENYVKVTDLKQIQVLLLYLAKRFHEICEENNLFYSMDSGTMLGGVRHKSFIPWDDDIDMNMPRPDYEKFIHLINEKYSDEFTIEAPEIKGHEYFFFAKFGLKNSILFETDLRNKYCERNLYIDIFPVNGFPKSTKILRKISLCYIFGLGAILKPFWNKNRDVFRNVFKIILVPIFYLLGCKHFVKKGLELCKTSDFETADDILFQYGQTEQISLKKVVYTNRTLYEFADTKFYGFSDYNTYLSKMYGSDYMTPPPENERFPKHGYDLFVKEELLECVKNFHQI